MRYSVMGATESDCSKVGATNIKVMPLLKQILCDLTPEQAAKLSSKGFIVKPIKEVRSAAIYPPETNIVAAGVSIGAAFQPLRDYYSPSLTGAGLTVAILDSGIRETHEALRGRVILQENFSTSPPGDVFDHGTNCASIIAGISPNAALMDIKVLNNKGMATEEEIIDGIERVCALVEDARGRGLAFTDLGYPNVINLSLGDEDDGDYDNPLRTAARVAVKDYGLEIIAAAGNSGPSFSTVMNPACDPSVIAVGGISNEILEVWEKSSRGPSLLGDIKPDFVTWAEGIDVASSKSNTAYEAKSGTSFSVPILSGARGLLGEIARRVYGEQYDITWRDIGAIAPLFCIKAEDAPLRKDNAWGYGFPMFGSIASGLARIPAETTMSSIIPIIGIGMLGMIMLPIMKGLA